MTLTAALALAGVAAWASESKETIELTDGSVYYGHTSAQDIRVNKHDFMYDSAIVVLPRSEIKNLKSSITDFESLSKDWQLWFKNHCYLIHDDARGKKIVSMHSLIDKQGNTSQIFLLSRTPKHITYVTKTVGRINYTSDKLKSTRYKHRDDLDITGVVTEIVTVDGQTITGQLVEDSDEGKGILTSGDVVEIVPTARIATIRRFPLDRNSKFENQVEFLDKITIEGDDPFGQKITYEGIISEINYRTEGKLDPYIILYDPTTPKEPVRIKYKDIKRISSISNKREIYRPRREVIPADTAAIVIKGNNIFPSSVSRNDNDIKVKANGDGSVEIPEIAVEDGKVEVYMTKPNEYLNCSFVEMSLTKKRTHFVVSYRDLNSSRINLQNAYVSPRNIVNFSLDVEPGKTYILDINDNVAYVFKISSDN